MPALPKEAPPRQHELPALRPAVDKRRTWLKRIALLAIAIGLLVDWTRPAAKQWSVPVFETGIVGGYRLLVRPVTKHFIRCRFQPTCSDYSVEAVRAYGFPRGIWLSAWRIARCGPWVKLGTVDPVPRPK